MDAIILTPRLKLALLTKAARGSPEFEWLHQLHSNEKATWWSINGRAKSIEDTEDVTRRYLPTNDAESEGAKTHRVAYTVHKILEPMALSVETKPQAGTPTEFIGLVTLKSLDTGSLALPEEFNPSVAAATATLTVELAYMFLPTGWGKGYATESVEAVFGSCKRARSFWAPFSNLYVRAIVNDGNPASLRVMDKTGMTKRGVYNLTGRTVFLAGEWREQHRLHIFGMHLLE
ncbi:uncharacterized protein A1O5_07840 [Cladophialophora psammophila CBS 110553]|uniref:N-acetyltransferase domain-containing protein n=1 Tax=Cladophialophora psammophila CBS 110553 TaxID=1182543 RepID=W9WM13_9EURO|nr:uncharacterized protein A1O5_07840 [Cladophialophora psammophila CBS 110553]EXJ68908.1 hypothetical protein A1O5_07840 [Cladophialophora psammophila CBS 110553]